MSDQVKFSENDELPGGSGQPHHRRGQAPAIHTAINKDKLSIAAKQLTDKEKQTISQIHRQKNNITQEPTFWIRRRNLK